MPQVPVFRFANLPSDTENPAAVLDAYPGDNALRTTRIEGGCHALRIEGKLDPADGSGSVYLYRYHDHSQLFDTGNPVADAAQKGWFPWLESMALNVDAAEFGGKFSAEIPIEESGPVDVIAVFDDSFTVDEDSIVIITGIRRS